MAHDLPPLEDDDTLGETVPNDLDSTRAYVPMPNVRAETPRGRHVAPIAPEGREKRRPAPSSPVQAQRTPMSGTYPKARKRMSESALYLPWWSLVVMLLVVMFATFLIVGGVYLLGGTGGVSPTQEPIIRIITAIPTDANLSDTGGVAPASTQIITSSSETNLALTGPTLEAVVFTPTAQPITVGSAVVVAGVGAQALNVRDQAGTLNTSVVFRVEDGTRFIIVDGPTQADGFTWWQVQDIDNASRTGWAVSNYLSVVVD